jgi:glutaredoxin
VKVELLVSDWCQSCHVAERVWREVAEERDIEFAVVDMGQPEGRALVSRLRLKSVPSTLIDGELKAVGVQTREQALALIAGAPHKAASGMRHVGLGMERTSRLAVLSAALYLFAAGSSLVVHGGLFSTGASRIAPLHLFTLGFLVFMVYGLGEHMLPRFTGNPIRLGALAWTQLGCAHAGVLGLALGLWLGVHLLAVLGVLFAWSGLLLFTLRIWPVLWSGRPSGVLQETD